MKAQAALLLTSRVGAAVLQAALLILVARETSPGTFGVLGAILGVVTLVVMFAALGTSQVVLRERSAGNDNEVELAFRLGSIGVWSLVVAGTLIAAVLSVIGSVPRDWLFTCSALVLALVFEKNAEMQSSLMIADQRRFAPAANMLARRGLSVLAFGAIITSDLDLSPTASFSIAYLLGSLVGWLVLLHANRARRTPTPIHRSDLKGAIRAAGPYLSNNLTTQARTLDVVLLAAVAGASQAGLYSAAYRFASPFLLVTTAIAMVMVPHAVRSTSTEARGLSKRTAMACVVGAVVLTPAAWVASPIVVSLLGPSFTKSGSLVPVLLCGMIFVGLSTLLGSILQARGKASRVSRLGFQFLPAVLLAVVLGAWAGGAFGAALGLVFTYALKSLIMFLDCLRLS